MFYKIILACFSALWVVALFSFKKENLKQEPLHVVVALPYKPNMPLDPHWYTEDYITYIANLLPSEGYQVSGYFVSIESIPEFLDAMQKLHVEKKRLCVLNICDGGEDWDGYPGISLLKLWEKHPINGIIPKTGADSEFTLNSDDKIKMQSILRQAKLNALAETLISPYKPLDKAHLVAQLRQDDLLHSWPLFCKLNIGAGGVAISDASICHSSDELLNQLLKMRAEFPKSNILVQPYLPGPEYTVLVVGDRVYAAVQRDFHNANNIQYEDYVTDIRPIEEEITYLSAPKHVQELALKAIKAIPGKHHYTRVDLRSDSKGNVYVIDINDRPSFGSPSTVKNMLEFNNLKESDLLRDIIETSVP